MVLNQSYQPLTVCDVKKAMTLICLGKAEMVLSDPEKNIRGVTKIFDFPSVIKLTKFVKVPFRGIELTRKNILKRDNHTCQYCGSSNSLTLDHIHPKSRGGEESWENLVVACISCNNRKGSRTPTEAGMPLRTPPRKPDYFMYLRTHLGSDRQEWLQFMYS